MICLVCNFEIHFFSFSDTFDWREMYNVVILNIHEASKVQTSYGRNAQAKSCMREIQHHLHLLSYQALRL